MRPMTCVVAALITSLAACDSATAPEECAGLVREGELHLVVAPTVSMGIEGLIFVGDTLALTGEVRPAEGAYKDIWHGGACRVSYGNPLPSLIEWSSSDNRIATVTANGVVVGRQAGDAVITARAPQRSLSSTYDIAVWTRGG